MKFLLALAMLFTMAVLVIADGVPTVVTYVPHDKVSATMAKEEPLLKTLRVLAQRRSAARVSRTGTFL